MVEVAGWTGCPIRRRPRTSARSRDQELSKHSPLSSVEAYRDIFYPYLLSARVIRGIYTQLYRAVNRTLQVFLRAIHVERSPNDTRLTSTSTFPLKAIPPLFGNTATRSCFG